MEQNKQTNNKTLGEYRVNCWGRCNNIGNNVKYNEKLVYEYVLYTISRKLLYVSSLSSIVFNWLNIHSLNGYLHCLISHTLIMNSLFKRQTHDKDGDIDARLIEIPST